MQAYASVYPCDHFTLIYPWHAGLEGSSHYLRPAQDRAERSPVVTVTGIHVGSDGFETTQGVFAIDASTGCFSTSYQ